MAERPIEIALTKPAATDRVRRHRERVMPGPLHVLIVEDRVADAELIVRALREGGFDPQWQRVETAAEYSAALRPDLDVILADHALPDFDAPRALRLLHVRGVDVPLIVVTGAVGEETAVECLKQGAADYLLKDRLGRLAQAVARALEEKRLREEARRAESARRESEGRFRRLTENAQDIIYRYGLSPIRGFEYISPAVTSITGYTPEQCYAHPDIGVRLARPDQRPAGAAGENGRTPIRPITFRFVRKDGTVVWLEQSAVAVFGSAGELVATEGLIRDVTEHRRTEDELRDSQHKLSAIVEASRDGIVVAEDEIIVFANAALVQLYGYGSPADLVTQHVSILRAPEDKHRVLESAGGLRGDTVSPFYEFKGKRKDGTALDLEASVSVATIATKPHVIAVIRDITQRKRLEEQFHQAQRMEAVGQLAAGIAHDFNNILTAILGYTELLLERCGDDDPRRAELEEIRNAGGTAASLTHQLLAFGRRQVLQPAALDLNGVVAGMETMLHRLISEDIEVRMRLDTRLGRVRADPGQIQQVIMNLAVNARDAMPGGGKLTIETANVDLEEEYARTHDSVATGPYVMLAVSDTGHGITPEVQARLFEPFFTTKEVGKGTGLGLSTVYGIVKQSGGTIGVYSEPGQGATFKIYLPRVDEPPTPVVCVPPAQDLPTGTETILLVEDNDSLRPLACKMLGRYGYHVLQARDADEAGRVIREHDGPIHLLFTDMVMPGIGGRQLAERLSLSHPGLKVLYTSGHTNNTAAHDWILEGGIAFLPKPFTALALARKIRDVLDSRAT